MEKIVYHEKAVVDAYDRVVSAITDFGIAIKAAPFLSGFIRDMGYCQNILHRNALTFKADVDRRKADPFREIKKVFAEAMSEERSAA